MADSKDNGVGSIPVSDTERFMDFARRGELHAIQEMIEADSKLLESRSETGFGNTALHWAASGMYTL
jgi:hypothetical protein